MSAFHHKTLAQDASSAVLPLGWPLFLQLVGVSLLGLVLSGTSTMAQEGAPDNAGAEATFQVVVHAKNPTTEIATVKIDRMFLKKLKRWDHGERVLPVDLEAKSPIRIAFTKSVHGKSVTAIKSFWQRMIFSGRDVPPEEKQSEKDVLDFVRANPGAIGYVATETVLGDGVKKLTIAP